MTSKSTTNSTRRRPRPRPRRRRVPHLKILGRFRIFRTIRTLRKFSTFSSVFGRYRMLSDVFESFGTLDLVSEINYETPLCLRMYACVAWSLTFRTVFNIFRPRGKFLKTRDFWKLQPARSQSITCIAGMVAIEIVQNRQIPRDFSAAST